MRSGPLPTFTLVLLTLLAGSGCQRPLAQPAPDPGLVKPSSGVFFDDFDYTGPQDPAFTGFHWKADSGTDSLGPKGASFAADHLTFLKDPQAPGNTLMQLTATAAGTGASTVQAGLSTQGYRFFEGTYAARVRFYDQPEAGPAVDQINETFYTISSFTGAMEPYYSECDFEYLARGGWGVPRPTPTLFMTTWHTYNPAPELHDNATRHRDRSLEGWHVLTVQVMAGSVRYYLDADFIAADQGKFYPRKAMAIAFNLWFLPESFCTTETAPRRWIEQVDWTYYACNRTLSPGEVGAAVADLRARGLTRLDTVR